MQKSAKFQFHRKSHISHKAVSQKSPKSQKNKKNHIIESHIKVTNFEQCKKLGKVESATFICKNLEFSTAFSDPH